jgi:hypothetical protein
MKHNRPTGAKHPRWNPGRIVSSHGYVMERVGVGHPLADSKGYAYSHVLVWASSGHPMPKPHETLHHRDGNKGNNRLDNLEVISRAEHSRLHAMQRRRRTDGTFDVEAAA